MVEHIDVDMTVHLKIMRYMEGDSLANPYKELNQFQRDYYKVHRMYVDILHLLEVGVNLTDEDELVLLEEWRKLAKQRRYMKELLKMYMYHHDYLKFMSDGIKSFNEYTFTSKYVIGKPKIYTLRSVTQCSKVKDVLQNIEGWEEKFPTVSIPKDYKEVELVKCGKIVGKN